MNQEPRTLDVKVIYLTIIYIPSYISKNSSSKGNVKLDYIIQLINNIIVRIHGNDFFFKTKLLSVSTGMKLLLFA